MDGCLKWYVIKAVPSSIHGHHFCSLNKAMCELIDGIAEGRYRKGLANASVFEYCVPRTLHETLHEGAGFTTTLRTEYCARRWFFHNIGGRLDQRFELDDSMRFTEARRRCVLHVYNYRSYRVGAVLVGERAEHCCYGKRWLMRYRCWHWFSNLSRSNLLRLANRCLGWSTRRLFSRHATVVETLYKNVVCSTSLAITAKIVRRIPPHNIVFGFENSIMAHAYKLRRDATLESVVPRNDSI